MRVGWTGIGRVVALTAVATSAFWIALGAWLFRAHVAADHPAAVMARAAPHGQAGKPAVQALLPARVMPSGLVIPVAGMEPARLTDTFTQARAGGQRRHDAIDIMAPEGTPVIAAAPGTVEKLFVSKDGGNTVYVRSADRRLVYYYAHLSAYATGLAEGARVKAGQVLGAVGHSGNASAEGPHLHFAITQTDPADGWYGHGAAINPYPLLTGRKAVSPPEPKFFPGPMVPEPPPPPAQAVQAAQREAPKPAAR